MGGDKVKLSSPFYSASLQSLSIRFKIEMKKVEGAIVRQGKDIRIVDVFLLCLCGGFDMKSVVVIEMGGTISAHGEHRLDCTDYISGKYDGIDFIEAIPELAYVADVRFETLLRVSSTAITSVDWLRLRARVMELLLGDDCDGVVITHGTNTIEETAYFLHLTVPTEKPIVVVGAQRPFTALSTDAHLNLLNGVRVAAADAALGRGVLVVLNNQISCAREVSKTSTYHLETFQNGVFGFLGFVDADGSVVFYRDTVHKHTVASAFSMLDVDLNSLPNVMITYSYAGADGLMIDAVSESGQYAGIVSAGTGAGLVAPLELAALERAVASGLLVVRSSRVGNGRVVPIAPYNGKGFLCADNLLPQKARILLMLALELYGDDVEQIEQAFLEY